MRKEIEIKKTELATLALAYKWPSAKIAEHYGVEPKDIQQALVTFGLRKSKAVQKDYFITLKDDLQISPSTPSLPTEPATSITTTATEAEVEEQMIF
jgi:hypothetical protein